MKGKKFYAAEKHFTKLQERYERQIKYLLTEISGLREKNSRACRGEARDDL